MDTRLREARLGRGWTQPELIRRLLAAAQRLGIRPPTPESMKTLVSMHENGRRPVGPDHRLLYCEVYEATDEELGIAAPNPSPDAPSTLFGSMPASGPQLPQPITPELISYLNSVFKQHAQAEPMVGPRFLLATMQGQMPLIDELVKHASTPLREEILRVGARYTEFIGWLYQDTGLSTQAARWTGIALELADELGDPHLNAHILQRRSNIATEAGHAGHGAGLANAALRLAPEITPRLRASALRQLANAKAALGERSEYERAVDAALAAAAEGDEADPLAGYCSVAYVEMESATGSVLLGEPGPAITAYRLSLEHWPEIQVRDRGLCLARLATASALLEDVESAYEAAAQALSIAEATGSARILDELIRLQRHLAPWRKLVEIAELNSALNAMKTIRRTS